MTHPPSAAPPYARPTEAEERPCPHPRLRFSGDQPPGPAQATTATAGAITTAAALAELGPPAEAAAGFVKGVDISWAPQMQANGYTWKNASGQTQDLLTILKGYGITAVRLRTFVNPSGSPTDGHCGIDEVAAFAERVKAAGMSIMLDYMFGDTWNSVGVQNPPAARKSLSMSYSQMLSVTPGEV